MASVVVNMDVQRKRRVQIVDDHNIVHMGLRALLPQDRYCVSSSALTAQSAIEDSKRTAIDLVILDLHLPDQPGEWVLDYYRTTRPTMPVLIYSATEDAAVAARCLERGARGYVCKNSCDREVLLAVESVLNGAGKYLCECLRMRMPGLEKSRQLLTPREDEVARLIAEGHGSRAISVKLGISMETLKKHRANLMKKIDAKRSTQIAGYVWREQARG
jgi:DNA-binding NarL/FixJ family response regulator